MKTCNIKINLTMKDVGVYATTRCANPANESGLCNKHEKARNKRLVPWGQRKDYGPITLEQMETGVSFKHKDTHGHRLLRLRGGIIQFYTVNNGWVDTEMPVDPEHYCKKIY